jgi:hypothetical protein
VSGLVDLDPARADRPAFRFAPPAAAMFVRPLFDLGPGFGRGDQVRLMGHADGLAVLQSLDGHVAHVAPHVLAPVSS